MPQNDSPSADAPGPYRSKRLIVIALTLVVLAAVSYLSLRSPLEWREGASIVSNVGDAEPKAKVTVPLVFREGGDVSHEGSHIFDTLGQVPGVARVKLTPAPPSVEVSFDPARTNEDTIRGALQAAGYGGQGQ